MAMALGLPDGGEAREGDEWVSDSGRDADHPLLVSSIPLQESLQLQEQAALEAEEGEGLQQTLRDLAQV